MTRRIVTVPPETSLRGAAAIVRDRQADELVVCDGKRLLGILTVHDLVADGLAVPEPPETIRIHRLMPQEEPVVCREDAILADAARAMSARRLRSIPVVDKEGTVVGVISLLDVAGAVMPNVAGAWLARMRASEDTDQPRPR